MQQTRKRISSGARNDGYLSTRHFLKIRSDHVMAIVEKTLSSQQPAERTSHDGTPYRTANRAAHGFAEIGDDPTHHLIGDGPRHVSRDNLTGRHFAAPYVGPENRSDDRADLCEDSPAPGPGPAHRGAGDALL